MADLMVNNAPVASGASRSALLKVASLFFEARYHHDAIIGQFLQLDITAPDPKRSLILNGCAYALISAIRLTDPTGHAAIADERQES